MNFSVAFSCSTPHLVCWSPSGLYLAVPDGNKLYIKDGHTAGSLVTSFTCCDVIKMLQWSPDSSLLLTGIPSSLAADSNSAVLQVWCLSDPEWRCCLELGSAGLLAATWAPDSRHLLVTELLHVRLSVWSLVTRTAVANIRHPKEASPGVQFSCDGAYLAVAERINCRDHLSILDTKTWQLVKQFPVCTRDLAGLAWGRGGDRATGTIMAVWDNVLTYSLTLYAMCGRALSSVKGAETYGLGVRTACWAPHGNYLLIGGQDTKLCLVNHMTWDISCERVHSPIIETSDLTLASGGGAVAVDEAQRVRVFREVNRALPVSPTVGGAAAAGMVHHLPPVSETAYSEELCRPVQLATSSTSTMQSAAGVTSCANHSSGGYSCVGSGYGAVCSPPQGGVSGGVTAVLFSPDGRYLATRVQQLPTVVWLWSLPKLVLLAVLVHNNPVRDLSWSPRQSRLVVVTGTDALFVWTGFGSLTLAVPRALALQPIAIRWHPSGSRLLLVGRGGQFSVCGLGTSALPPPHRGATSRQRAANASNSTDLRQHSRCEEEPLTAS